MQNIYTRNYYYTRLLSIIINIFIYYIYLFQFRLRSCVRVRVRARGNAYYATLCIICIPTHIQLSCHLRYAPYNALSPPLGYPHTTHTLKHAQTAF